MASSSTGWRPRQSDWEFREYPESVGELDGSDGEKEVDPDNMTQTECSQEFLNFIVHLKLTGTLSARQACTLSFWAKRGGLCEPGSALALDPRRDGGAASKHFDKALGIDQEVKGDFYNFPLPVLERFSLGRGEIVCAANMLYKRVKQEIEAIPGFFDDLQAAVETESWGPRFRAHPLVLRHGARQVVPLGLYVDGVPFLKRDSATAFWLINLATTERHLALVLRKRQLCRCGCKGWCTMWSALACLQWNIAAMHCGRFPHARHDGSPWAAEDPNADLADRDLGYFGAVLMIKGDWAEFSLSMGFPTWASRQHPCFACFCTGGPEGTMAALDGVSVLSLPWRTKGAAEYEEACRAAEVRVMVTSETQYQELLGRLFYDKRSQGSCGRALLTDFAALGLLRGDRLEPCHLHPNVSLEHLPRRYPMALIFWRPERESLAKHRNPLFEPNTGITPLDFCIDEMHTLHLGTFQIYIVTTLWAAIVADVWQVGGGISDEAANERSALRMRHDLFAWYAAEKLREPQRPLYQLTDFNLKVLGSRDRPHLSAKAAESGTLLRYSVDLCRRFCGKLPNGAALLGAGDALVCYLDITRSASMQLRPSEQQGVMDAFLRFLHLRKSAGIPWKPKMHLMLHLASQCRRYGNPLGGATWHDEGLNRTLASVCRTAHAAVWQRRVLGTFNHAAGPRTRQAKRVR